MTYIKPEHQEPYNTVTITIENDDQIIHAEFYKAKMPEFETVFETDGNLNTFFGRNEYVAPPEIEKVIMEIVPLKNEQGEYFKVWTERKGDIHLEKKD